MLETLQPGQPFATDNNAVLNLEFRPFFAAAAVFAVLSMAVDKLTDNRYLSCIFNACPGYSDFT